MIRLRVIVLAGLTMLISAVMFVGVTANPASTAPAAPAPKTWTAGTLIPAVAWPIIDATMTDAGPVLCGVPLPLPLSVASEDGA